MALLGNKSPNCSKDFVGIHCISYNVLSFQCPCVHAILLQQPCYLQDWLAPGRAGSGTGHNSSSARLARKTNSPKSNGEVQINWM